MTNSLDKLIEVRLSSPENFLKIKETLERIGVAAFKTNTLYQSCHILHKKQKYFIVHFKELFLLDGKPATITEQDLMRRNTIASLLSEWQLLEIVSDEHVFDNGFIEVNKINIIPYKDKHNWKLVAKYTLGKK